MENNKKDDTLYVNEITRPDDVKHISNNPVGNAIDNPCCIYNHQRHAVGSIVKNEDGTEMICTESSEWQRL